MRWLRNLFDPDGYSEPAPSLSECAGSRVRPPRLAAVRQAPSRDAFEVWRENPVTEFVFAAMREAQNAQQDMWLQASWQSGAADQVTLAELRARADAYAAIEEATYEALCEWAGVEPEHG